MMHAKVLIATLTLWCAVISPARAQDFPVFTSKGLPGSEGLVVRVSHPSGWKRVALDDELALAELRGPLGRLTGILQIGRGPKREDIEALCRPERARTMLQNPSTDESDARVTDVVAREHEGRPGYDIRYERKLPPDFMLVRSRIVCLKNSKVVVSCGAMGAVKAALADIEPVCSQVLGSLRISED